ncbi:hypothetical protein CIL05_06745 [Virgibacillus profundi]|uniref:Peptidase S74 domain-containing protein n=1 Tax=Virgibacillus profundi TaxID=2024555 RepID=A0A2A2IEK6_9BACI|nr:phage tail protein [Virgibacillus profundi]PAV30159.1 hypothetical protein CIL05_06745 [Virgibacillus profundi]PXY54331.1 hypothetical protein CIT14_06830 [Virgibacillus profundi]
MYTIDKIEPKQLSLWLAKPDKTKIAKLTTNKKTKHIKNETLTLDHNDSINVITFTVPFEVELDVNSGLVKNPVIDKIKEKFLVKSIYDKKVEWFVVHRITKSSNESDDLIVTCYSLAHQLTKKKMIGYLGRSKNCLMVTQDVLRGEDWKPGYINPEFNLVWRQFDVSSQSKLDFLYEIAETFDAIIRFDSVNKTVNFYKEEEISFYKGFSVGYGKYIQNVEEHIDASEIVTRLHVYGSEGLTINSVNPTGQRYIDDFSYFLYPFSMDDEGKITSHSDFMEDGLAKSLVHYNQFVSDNKDTFRDLLEEKRRFQQNRTEQENELTQLELDLEIILDSIQVAKETNQSTTDLKKQRDLKNTEISDKKQIVDSLNSQINNVDEEIQKWSNLLKMENHLTMSQMTELSNFVQEEEWTDSNLYDESDLYEAGLKELADKNSPPIDITVSLVNFLQMVSESHNWDRFSIGDIIRINHAKLGIDVKATLSKIEFDFENAAINVTISNTKRLNQNKDQGYRVLYTIDKVETDTNKRKINWDKAAYNFNLRNDRISEKPTRPTPLSLEHQENDDGSVNLNLKWEFPDYSDTDKNEDNIDGFVIYLHHDTDNEPYQFGSKMGTEEMKDVSYGARSLSFPSVPSNLYYTIGIQAYRRVDEDINRDGILFSDIVRFNGVEKEDGESDPGTLFSLDSTTSNVASNSNQDFNDPLSIPYQPSTDVNVIGRINGSKYTVGDEPELPNVNDVWISMQDFKTRIWDGENWSIDTELGDEITRIEDIINSNTEMSEETLEKLEDAKREIRDAEDRIKEAEDELEQGDKRIGEAIEELERLDQELINANLIIDQANIDLGVLDEELRKANVEIDNAKIRIGDAEQELIDADLRLDTAEQDLINLGDDLAGAETRLGNAETDLGTAKEDIITAKGRIDTAVTDLDTLETDLGNVRDDVADKVDLSIYNSKITDLTNDIASKVDGDWVNGRLRVAIDDIEIGGRNLVIADDVEPQTWINSDGSVVTENNAFTTGLIAVEGEGTLTSTQTHPEITTASAISEYDENRQFIRRISNNSGKVFTYNLGENTRFVRYSGKSPAGDYEEGIKLEKGNKATDWTPAPEDIFADIDIKADLDNVYIKADIDDMFDNTVSLTAYQTDQDNYVQRFVNYETNISQTWDAINLRVTEETYNALEGRMTGAEGRINTIAGQVELKAESSVVEGQQTWISTATVDINALKNDITLKVEQADIDGAIGDLEIGGRNYFRPSLVNNLALSGTVVESSAYRGYTLPVVAGEVYSISRENLSNNRFRVVFTEQQPDDGVEYIGGAITRDTSLKIENITVPNSGNYMLLYLSNQSDKIPKVQIEKGNKATDWTPAPEDHASYTRSQVKILEDAIELSYVKDDELIAGIRIGDDRINGANVEITGDTLIKGSISAPDATFLDLTTRRMTAIETTIQDSTITGTLTATNSVIVKGTFNDIIANRATLANATVTGTIGADNAIFNNATMQSMTAISSTFENSTVTGTLTATNTTILHGTFDTATIVDATIEDSTVTGTLSAATAVISKGTFNDIIANRATLANATVTGTIGAANATFTSATMRDMTAISATLQSSTVTGTLTAANATILKGTFDEATIVDATIENAVITGELVGVSGEFVGSLVTSGPTGFVTIENDTVTSSSPVTMFGTSEKVNMFGGIVSLVQDNGGEIGGQAMFIRRNEIETTTPLRIRSPELSLLGGNIINFANGSSIDNTGSNARWRRTNSDYIMQNYLGDVQFYKSGDLFARFTTVESYDHGWMTMGKTGLKMLNGSSSQMQVRNLADTAYTGITGGVISGSDIVDRSQRELKKNIELYQGNALKEILDINVQCYNLKEDEDWERKRLGVIVDEAPLEIITDKGEGISAYAMVSLVTKGVQQFHEDYKSEIKALKERIRILEESR